MKIFLFNMVILFLTWHFSAQSMLQAEEDEEPQPGEYIITVTKKLSDDAINCEKRLLCQEAWINRILVTSLAVVAIGPFSALWIADSFYPENKNFRPNLYYWVTPLALINALLSLNQLNTQSPLLTIAAKKKVRRVTEFLANLNLVCKKLKIISSKKEKCENNPKKNMLKKLIDNRLPVGICMQNIHNLLVSAGVVKSSLGSAKSDDNDMEVYDCDLIFDSILNAIQDLSPPGYLREKITLLEVYGCGLFWVTFFSMSKLEKKAVDIIRVSIISEE